MGFIYKITNLENNKCYIGQTSRTCQERWREHTRDRQKEPYCNWPLYRMLNKTPPDKIIWEIIEEVDNNLLNEREIYWIAYYDSFNNGYNARQGGDNGTKYDYQEILNYWLNEGECSFTKTAQHFNSHKVYISKIIHVMGYERRDWKEVNNKDHENLKRKINKIDMKTGKVLQTYDSMNAAARDLGDENYSKTIVRCCKNNLPSYLGYCWQYVEDIGKPILLNKQQKTIVAPTLNMTFDNLTQCAEYFIENNICRGKQVKAVSGGISNGIKKHGKYYNIPLEFQDKIIYSYY